MTLGWGSESWGADAWGGAGAGAVSARLAVATSRYTVRVYFTAPIFIGTSLQPGSALNPGTWQVVNDATSKQLTVLGVNATQSEAELYLLSPLDNEFVTHTVAFDTLLDAGGLSISAPRSASFYGIRNTPQLADAKVSLRDVLNNPVPHSVSGTLVVSSSGDYEEQTGDELLKKLLMRRLTTARGAFVHLEDYGDGLTVKAPLGLSDLRALRTQIERSVTEEPEVKSVQVSLVLFSTQSILEVSLSIMTQSKRTIQTTIPVRISNG